jgi:hypothetical protein
MTKLFLDFVQYDHGGRIFTYVLTLDGQFRFTETGKEFGIDMLSKHTMHSDVSIYIAFSGEFFVRRLKQPRKNKDPSPDPSKEVLPSAPEKEDNDDRPKSAESHKDPMYHELIIDNDSGTYRPNAKTLRTLKQFMAQNLPGLRVVTLDCQADGEKMKKLKNEQREKKKASGQQITYLQNNSMSSISSSEEAELEDRAAGREHHEHLYKKQLHKYAGHGVDDFHGERDHEERPMMNDEASHPPAAKEKMPESTNANANGPMNTVRADQAMNEKENFGPNGDLDGERRVVASS